KHSLVSPSGGRTRRRPPSSPACGGSVSSSSEARRLTMGEIFLSERNFPLRRKREREHAQRGGGAARRRPILSLPPFRHPPASRVFAAQTGGASVLGSSPRMTCAIARTCRGFDFRHRAADASPSAPLGPPVSPRF